MQRIQSLAEEALCAVAVFFELLAASFLLNFSPTVTEGEGHRQDRHQSFESDFFGQMGALKIKASFLEMAEKALNPPTTTIEVQGFLSLETIADQCQVGIAPLGDALGRKVNLLFKDFMTVFGRFLPAHPPAEVVRAKPSDQGILFYPDNVSNPFVVEPPQPLGADEFTVHGENPDVGNFDQSQDPLHDFEAMGFIGISPFGFLWQHHPGDGKAHSRDHHSDGEDVDMGFTELPVGAIHRKNPTAGGSLQKREDQGGNGLLIEGKLSQKALETTTERGAL